MRKFLCKLCVKLEKMLYGENSWEQLEKKLYTNEYLLDATRAENAYLKKLLAKK